MAKDGELSISVVIATYKRCEVIPITLRHLARQTLPPSQFEVILVDDGSSDNTEAVARNLMGTMPYRLRYIRHPNHGIGYTQNQGILAAHAPIVALIADDIFYTPEALETIIWAHNQHPEESVAVLGKVAQSSEIAGRSIFLKHWDPFKFRVIEDLTELPYYYFWACNISCKRDFLWENGLFDESMGWAGPAAHEDVELGYRLGLKGLRIIYEKKALAYHHHFETLDGAIKRAYERGLNWKDFRGRVNDPSITVRYHLLNRYTWRDHYLAYITKPNHLMGVDKNPFLLLLLQLVRKTVFNFFTVPNLWLPLLRQAETNPPLGALMHWRFYQGVISYHFHKGATEAYRRFKDFGTPVDQLATHQNGPVQ
jgi:glycosyltransferase involved in cell wall biosynthesis